MPFKIATPCRCPGCGALTREPFCADHKSYEKAVKTDYEKRYASNRDPRYKTQRWVKSRAHHAAKNPLCADCLLEGRVVPMKIVDHVEEVKDGGDFFNPKNFRSLCTEHHNRKTADEKKKRGCRVI